MQVKVCGLRDKDNIIEILKLVPEYIGLIFFPDSPRYVGNGNNELKEYVSNIDSVSKVGVFVDASYRTILDAVNDYGLHFVQLHGNESPDFCACLKGHVRIIKAFPLHDSFYFGKLLAYEDHCDYFLFDTLTTQYGGSGKVFDWKLLKHYTLQNKYFISGGISLENKHLLNSIEDTRLLAVDVNSRFEIAPGIKNIHKIKRLIHEIRD